MFGRACEPETHLALIRGGSADDLVAICLHISTITWTNVLPIFAFGMNLVGYAFCLLMIALAAVCFRGITNIAARRDHRERPLATWKKPSSLRTSQATLEPAIRPHRFQKSILILDSCCRCVVPHHGRLESCMLVLCDSTSRNSRHIYFGIPKIIDRSCSNRRCIV